MANTTSAKKAHRAASRRRVFNLRRASTMKRSVKEIRKAIAVKSADVATMLPTLQQALDKAVKRGIIKKNAAARTKSRIAKRIAALAK